MKSRRSELMEPDLGPPPGEVPPDEVLDETWESPVPIPEPGRYAAARRLRGSVYTPRLQPPLDRFSLRKAAPRVTQGWRALDRHPLVAPLIYMLQRVRYSRAGRIAMLAALLTPCLVLATFMAAGFEEVHRFVEKARTEHTTFLARPDTVVLVMGTDDVPTEGMSRAPGRSDTMMLLNIQYQEKRIRLLSIPRDTFVFVDYGRGVRGDKIAHAYRRGSLLGSLEAVERLTGLRPDHYVTIDYGLFRDFVDEIGGVPVEIEKRMFYEDKAGGLRIDFQPGLQVLDGQKALEYVRFRKDGRGDMGRIARQQKFLRAIVQKLLHPKVLGGLLKPDTINRFLEHLDTDMVPSQVLPLGYRFRDADPAAFETKVFPGQHAMRETPWTRTLSFFFVDWEQADRLLDEWFLSTPRSAISEEETARRIEDQTLQARILAGGEDGDGGGEDVEDDDSPDDDQPE